MEVGKGEKDLNAKRDPYDIDFTSTTAKVPWYDKIIHSMYGAYSFQVSWVIFGYYLVYFYTDVVAASVFLPLVNFFGGNGADEAKGYFWAAFTIGITVMIFQVLNVFMTRKYELNKDGSCREHLRQVEHENVFSQLKNFGRNRPAIILQIGEVLKQIMQAIKNWSHVCRKYAPEDRL